jgi:hypothetical protein
MGLTTNGVVITESIKFGQTNKEKLTIATKKKIMLAKIQMNLIMVKITVR